MAGALAGVICLIVVCGIVGGYAGYLLSPPTSEDLNGAKRPWWVWRAIVLGIVAAMLVPLFLKLPSAVIGSQDGLTQQLLSEGGHAESWLVFAGFCLIAATSSQRFVSNLTDAIFKNMQQQMKQV